MSKSYIAIRDVVVVGLSETVGYRRSFNSQNKGDSKFLFKSDPDVPFSVTEFASLGEKDLKGLGNLVVNGDSHAKTNRFVQVYHTIKAPRRWWVDYDTYRIGRKDAIHPDDIEYMSDSTMHCIHRGFVTPEDFTGRVFHDTIGNLNDMIHVYLEGIKDKKDKVFLDDIFLIIKDNLPEGFLQERRVLCNYQALRHIYFDRRNHRQPEFIVYSDWIHTLPYADVLITKER